MFNHPSLDFLRFVIDQLFDFFNIGNYLLENINDTFSYHQLPIHPSVASYFELRFVDDGVIWRVGPHKVVYENYVRLYIKGYRMELGKNVMTIKETSRNSDI